jgi:hypothetical protein
VAASTGSAETQAQPRAPSGPQLGRRAPHVNPFVVLALAFLAGQILARAIDWRSHAHPHH